MAYVRVQFPGNDKRNGSILKYLLMKWGAREVEQMLRGAARLGFEDLRPLYSRSGDGRRTALAAYFGEQKRAKAPESLRSIFKGWENR